MSALAIVLARGGSKGAPGKNAAIVAGKPCISWSIEHAIQSDTINRVALSSDSDELLDIAHALGIETVRRPETLANDLATIDDAARHAVDTLGGNNDPIALLYGNVPVRPARLLDRAVRTLLDTNADSVQSYETVGKYHPWWTARIDADGRTLPWEGDTLNHGVFRRQDLPPAHIPDGGALVVTRRALFLQIDGVPKGPHAFFGADRRGITTEQGTVIDIDTPADILVADAALRMRTAATP